MAESVVQLGDVGTVFRVTCVQPNTSTAEDISTATVLRVLFGKPSGSTLSKAASFTTDGTDGKLQYATIEGDLDEVGLWKLQGYFETPLGEWHTEVGRFRVKSNVL